MPPLFRDVFEAVSNGSSAADVMAKFKLREIQVTNILKEVRARIAVSIAAKQPLPTASKNLIFSVSRSFGHRCSCLS